MTAQMFGDAARGDLDALRMLRDTIAEDSGLPIDERLAQAEVVAWMAAEAGGPMDKLSLSAVLYLRAEHLFSLRDVCRIEWLRQVGLKDQKAADEWQDKAAAHELRAFRLKEIGEGLYPEIMGGADPEAAARLASALTTRADRGEDECLVMLQRLIDGMPKQNLGALKAAIRNLEQEIDA